MSVLEKRNIRVNAEKEMRATRKKMHAVTDLKRLCQGQKWVCSPNVRTYSDDPTMGYVVGDPEWVAYMITLQIEDAKRQAEEEAKEKEAKTKEDSQAVVTLETK